MDSAISATTVADRSITSSTQPCNFHRQTLTVEWTYWRAQWLSMWHCHRLPPFQQVSSSELPRSTVNAVIVKWKRVGATMGASWSQSISYDSVCKSKTIYLAWCLFIWVCLSSIFVWRVTHLLNTQYVTNLQTVQYVFALTLQYVTFWATQPNSHRNIEL